MAERYFTFNGHAIGGNGGAGMVIMDIPELPAPAANTLRFDFSDKNYDPTVAGVGSAGTWTKLSHPLNNIWDWTNNNTNWAESFKGAFPDPTNEVSVIAAGDTSAVTNIGSIFAGIYTDNPGATYTYHLTTRNNIVECVNFDLSGCVANNSALHAFCGSSLRHANIDLSHVGGSLICFYGDTMLTEVGNIDCSSTYYIGIMFAQCHKLTSVGTITVSSRCTITTGIFNDDQILEHFGGFIGDTSSLGNYQGAFQNCMSLRIIDNPLNLSASSGNKATVATFNGCYSLTSLPFTNMTSAVTSLYAFAANCKSITEIPTSINTSSVTDFRSAFLSCESLETISNIDVSSATNVNSMFKNCKNVKYGILDMYNALLSRGSLITDHTNCFLNCGSETEEGRTALAQIPESWGGTMVEPGE